jgi:hypothetical protein
MPEFPPDAAPREIVTALHDQMARMSPEFAALVAAFRQIPPPRRTAIRQPRTSRATPDRIRRATVYNALRLSGASMKAAARKAGVGPGAGRQYEADFLATLGGGM